jgi:mannose-6-phosphate isomerase-like protein (cupin superfamily)
MYHTEDRKPVLVHPGSARAYDMGRIKAYFHADGKETAGRYSISEWWLEPFTQGPGAHSHEHDDDVFYVLEGVMSFLVGETWVDAARGSFVLAPAGVTHAFENRGSVRAGVLNFYTGPFEAEMPDIVEWFAKHPPADTERTSPGIDDTSQL